MTASGAIQNYRGGSAPTPWTGSNGVSTLATDITQPLAPFKPYFSILNGVMMSPAFDGHDQNFNFLFTGNPFGGENFVPHLNLGARPLDAIQKGRVRATLTNSGATVPISVASAGKLVASLGRQPPLDPSSALFAFMNSRFQAISTAGTGALSSGSLGMWQAFQGAPALSGMLSGIQATGNESESNFVKLAAQFFKSGAAGAAIIVPDTSTVEYDTHDVASAQAQPAAFALWVSIVASILQTLKDTPFDSARSLMDVTTFMITPEFGRTMKQYGKPVDQTGTDHNPLSNSVLIGGKGIQGGLVMGASDYAASTETLSGAHLALDALKLKVMGRPFDFSTGLSRTDLPTTFHAGDYLGFNSIVNTIYKMYGVPSGKWRLVERNGVTAPVLPILA
jgi:hypothetical protein